MSVQPAGTVTFLFTDIEGSTRLLSELGTVRYAEALERHRELIRAAARRHDGYEVDCEGDAFFIAFQTAIACAAAAAQAQTALAAEHWPAGCAFRVRMGIHTGQPLLAPPKYVGLDVHTAARIMACGHGGQVVVSAATRDALGDSVETRDLGEHRLKDLSRPQRLYQLQIAGLPAEFPSLKTLYRTNLPIAVTPFLGREPELGAVCDLLRESVRILTLTGPGGVGKTRLALQAAAEAADSFPGGVFWVPLAPVREVDLVLEVVARVLDVADDAGRELVDSIAARLGGERLLLVLDNAEHLLPEIAGAVASLAEVPGPTLLVTSRERLRVQAEHIFDVPSLSETDGVGLFEARARQAGARLDGVSAVTELCRRLDGLPLAIELAAARTTVFSASELLERFEQRLDLLKGGRDAEARQQTLRATIDWSYRLLSPEEQRVFAALAVFADGATFDAAEVVARAGAAVLESLLDKSLLRRRDTAVGSRYWMLETIWEFAFEQLLESGGEPSVRHEHARYYADFLERAAAGYEERREQAIWLERVSAEYPNIRGAFESAMAAVDIDLVARIGASAWDFWAIQGHLGEGSAALERALRLMPEDDTGRRAPLLAGLGAIAGAYGDTERAVAASREAIELFRSLGDVRRVALNSYGLALALIEADELDSAGEWIDKADELLREAIELARGAGDARTELAAMGSLANLSAHRSEYHQAAALFTEIAARAHETDREQEAYAVSNLGLIHAVNGDYEQGFPALCRALELLEGLGWREAVAYTFGGLAALAESRGDVTDAVVYLAVAYTEGETIGLHWQGQERRLRDTTRERLEARLGDDFGAAWAEAAAAAPADVIARILGRVSAAGVQAASDSTSSSST